MKTLVNQCLATSRHVVDGRNRFISLAHASEELGELSEQVLIEEGVSYKEPKEGVIGEAIDLIICGLDLIYLTKPTITEAEIMAIADTKLNKWRDHFDAGLYAKQKEEYPNVELVFEETKPKFEGVYLGQWSNQEDVENDFFRNWASEQSTTLDPDVEILLAYYEYRDYSGEAFVLFRQCGTLYTVEGGHCSCYGLEDQWDPTETDVSTLKHRLSVGSLGVYNAWDGKGTNLFAKELLEVLEKLE